MALLFLAAASDLKKKKIPNTLIYIGLCAGVGYRIATEGAYGAREFIISIIWPLLLLYILFYIRALGAGDIKLFCMISPFLSARGEIKVIIISFILGAGFSCQRIFREREFALRLFMLGTHFRKCISQKRILKYSTVDKDSSYVCFSFFILAGYLLVQIGDLIW